jgi:hypothetical protein
MTIDDILSIIDDVPDYQAFLTVDELKASTRRLANMYPDIVEILPIGRSRQGDAIEAIRLGNGSNKALLFAMPHPNEPIGSMMLEFLSLRLAEDDALRQSLGYTWYMIKCIDPDGTRLNEGWFKGPFSIGNYARHYYRPPSFQQVAWTFPIDYKTLHFHNSLPETQALMALIEEVRPAFMYSLHNSDFGGVYFYIWDEAPPLYEPFHRLVESQGLPLHLGEPERPYETEYATAIYKDSSIAAEYDYLEEHTDNDPAAIIKGGTLSFEYARQFCDPFTLICEAPYFNHPAIGDSSPSDTARRDAILQEIEETRAHIGFMQALYDEVKDELTVPSPFHLAIEHTLTSSLSELDARASWARTSLPMTEMATASQKFDSLVINRFYRLLSLGMFVRMLNAQVAATGESPSLCSARETAKTAFETRCAALEAELDYTVVPIQELVRVQLGSALLAADYAAGRRARRR